jgi:hypothetical protein
MTFELWFWNLSFQLNLINLLLWLNIPLIFPIFSHMLSTMQVSGILFFAALAIASRTTQDISARNAVDGDASQLEARDGIDCGPGNGVWVMSPTYFATVDEFCKAAEGSDISDGYMAHDTYLVELSPQGGQTTGDAGKIICKSTTAWQSGYFYQIIMLTGTSHDQKRGPEAGIPRQGLDKGLRWSAEGFDGERLLRRKGWY